MSKVKRLFLYQTVHTGDAGGSVLDLHIKCGRKHEYNRETTEVLPMEILSYIITTTDITVAVTGTLSLYSNSDAQQLFIYDVSPNLDNNTIELKSYSIVEDGATAGTDALTGSNIGFKTFRDTYMRFVLSGAVDNTDTMTIRVLYVAEEFAKFTAIAGAVEESYHLELGVFE